ncbi:MAG: type II toxin-antitoxin system VapC family toxin [Acidobacteria bacterium]|nr:type II toxin-antitoxin system VapC family toxin [Acidobacteriota bacterium]
MSVYLDSSAVIKLYVPEDGSAEVARYVQKRRQPLPLSPLHEFELKNALRAKVFRKQASRRSVRAALQHLCADIAAQIYVSPPLDWLEVFEAAEALSQRFTATIGGRFLDFLHVASAKILKVRGFLTFDERQATQVRKAGIKLVRV